MANTPNVLGRASRLAGALVRIARRRHLMLTEWLIDYHDAEGARSSFIAARPCAVDGSSLPWMTFPAIRYFDQLDLSHASVFEYGCGRGSLYWGGRAQTVLSVEDDSSWADEIEATRTSNLKIIRAKAREDYINAIQLCPGPPDLVIVDGSYRLSCTKAAIEALAPSGMIILDNSDWHPLCCSALAEAGFIQFDFIGPGPINRYAWATSIFVRCGGSSVFPRLQGPPSVRGGLDHTSVEE